VLIKRPDEPIGSSQNGLNLRLVRKNTAPAQELDEAPQGGTTQTEAFASGIWATTSR
jgi:hypothetical protein